MEHPYSEKSKSRLRDMSGSLRQNRRDYEEGQELSLAHLMAEQVHHPTHRRQHQHRGERKNKLREMIQNGSHSSIPDLVSEEETSSRCSSAATPVSNESSRRTRTHHRGSLPEHYYRSPPASPQKTSRRRRSDMPSPISLTSHSTASSSRNSSIMSSSQHSASPLSSTSHHSKPPRGVKHRQTIAKVAEAFASKPESLLQDGKLNSSSRTRAQKEGTKSRQEHDQGHHSMTAREKHRLRATAAAFAVSGGHSRNNSSDSSALLWEEGSSSHHQTPASPENIPELLSIMEKRFELSPQQGEKRNVAARSSFGQLNHEKMQLAEDCFQKLGIAAPPPPPGPPRHGYE